VIGRGLVTLLAVSALVFLAIHLIPGSFADLYIPPEMSSMERRTSLVDSLGLNQPLPLQYVHWFGSIASGNFGVDLISDQPVANELGERLPATGELTFLAMLLSLGIGIPLGVAASFTGRFPLLRGASRLVGSAGLSFPDFVLASVLVFIFSSNQLGVTVGGYVPFAVDPIANIRAMALPAIALSIFATALIVRTTRDSVLNVMPEPYVGAAVARGETPLQIVRRHVLRNASLPVLTVAAVNSGYLLGGAIIIETIFSIPGIGAFAVAAVKARNYPVVEACVLIGAAVFVTLNTVADLAYPLIDPRIRARAQNR
jgi:peptide/nickel transport system permease protein